MKWPANYTESAHSLPAFPSSLLENWTQPVHNVQFLYFMVKIMTAHKECNRIEEAYVTHSDTDGGKWSIA